jgi:hypothetical protein
MPVSLNTYAKNTPVSSENEKPPGHAGVGGWVETPCRVDIFRKNFTCAETGKNHVLKQENLT